jgi:HD-like signal output (HDOD) protein
MVREIGHLASSHDAQTLVVDEVQTPSQPEPKVIESPAQMAALLNIKLPPLPNAAMRVAELCRDVNTSASVVADAIGYDPALASRILRAANSSLYSRERHVTALTTAVNVLGLRPLYQLTISYAASSLFDRPNSPSLVERSLWRHAVFVALATREITLSFGLHGSEESFLCGLLHDVGKGLMLQHNSKLYTPLLEIADEDELLAAEQEAYGFTHPQLSALVVNHWGLSSDMSDAILNHHDPDQAVHSLLVTRALRVADKLAKASGYGIAQNTEDDLEADESTYLLGLTAERLGEITEHVEESMSEMMSILLR